MNHRRHLAWAIVVAIITAIAATATLGRAPPAITLDAPVTDRADVLSPSAEAHLDATLIAHRAATGVQIAVLTVPTTHGVPIEDFSHDLATAWAGGRAGVDDGVLLTLAIDDRRMRLEVGRGLEAAIPDGAAAAIIESMIPALREGDPREAIATAITAVIAATGGETSALAALPRDPFLGGAARDLPSPPFTDHIARAWGSGVTLARIVLGLGLACWLIWLLIWLYRTATRAPAAARARLYRDHGGLTYGGFALVTLAPMTAGLTAAFRGETTGAIAIPLIIGSIALVGGVIALHRARAMTFNHWRHHPRPCPEGDGMMRALSADEATAHLTPGQITEHAIQSRIHDVWICPNGHARLETYQGDSPASHCTTCKQATVRAGAWQTTRAATYSHGGQQARTDTCAHCGARFHHTRSTPRKQRTVVVAGGGGGSSRGGGGGGWSGGGGSFGGGGASGSW